MSCKICGHEPGNVEVCPVCGWLQVDVPTVPRPVTRTVPTFGEFLSTWSVYLAVTATLIASAAVIATAVTVRVGAAVLTITVPAFVVATVAAVTVARSTQRGDIADHNVQADATYQATLEARYVAIEANKARLLAAHRQRLRARITTASVDAASTPTTDVPSGPSPARTFGDFALVDAAGLSGVSVAELMWTWARIDPEVVRAAAFASPNAHIHNAYGFVRLINGSYARLGPAGQTAAFNRLAGYVGEQRYYHLMTQAGHAVKQAGTSNQPVWDFMVDGHPVNVKTYAHVGTALRNVAGHHPDVRYAIPADAHAHGHLAANIERVAGLSHRDATEHLHQAVRAAQGDTAGHQLAHLLPIITVGVATYRIAVRLRAGEQATSAVTHAVLETVGRAGGALLGSKGGALLGAPFGPPGAITGGFLGGAGGAIVGGVAADFVKQARFERAQTKLHDALVGYWSSAAHRDTLRVRIDADIADRDRVAGQLRAIADQVQASSRWRTWPAETDMLAVVTAEYAATATRAGRADAAPVLALLQRAATDGDAQARLGTMLANTPELADVVGADPDRLAAIRASRRAALEVREGLYPGTTPYAKPAAVIRVAQRSVKVLELPGHSWFHAADCATVPCPTLARDLAARADAGWLRRRRDVRHLRDELTATVLDMDSLFKRRIKPCPDCEPRIDATVAAHLVSSSPRRGWHVEAGTGQWWCDEHHCTICEVCPDGLD